MSASSEVQAPAHKNSATTPAPMPIIATIHSDISSTAVRGHLPMSLAPATRQTRPIIIATPSAALRCYQRRNDIRRTHGGDSSRESVTTIPVRLGAGVCFLASITVDDGTISRDCGLHKDCAIRIQPARSRPSHGTSNCHGRRPAQIPAAERPQDPRPPTLKPRLHRPGSLVPSVRKAAAPGRSCSDMG